MLQRLLIILEMIKFEHTIFALPFALIAALVGVDGFPGWSQLGWITVAMVGARSSAMTVNRIVDLEIDRHNPRTATRALPTGQISRGQAWLFAVVSAATLVLAAAMLNPLAFWLSPLALAIIWGYSYTKRFTPYSHLVLGLALGIAPSAAWIALTGRLDLPPVILSTAVLAWTAGFDIIYACQDVDYDRRVGLFSIPAQYGIRSALTFSSLLHVIAFMLFVAFGLLSGLSYGFLGALIPVALLLVVQHQIVKADDLRRVNAAFFTANGVISLLLLFGVIIDRFLL